MQAVEAGKSRTQAGLPVSVEFDQGGARLYAGAGYFTSGMWFAGAGVTASVGAQTAVSAVFSHARTTEAVDGLPHERNEISGGLSWSPIPRVSLFGSIGQSVATADADGAGTTVSVGVSFLLNTFRP